MADGLLPGMARYHAGGATNTASPVCSSPKLSYFGGPLLQNPVVVAVFWSSAVNAQIQASMPQFYADVMASSYWSWLQEYDSVGLTPGTSQAILPGTAPAGVVIAPQKCNPGGANCKLADTDIQAELTRQIGLGLLPAPSLDCTGNANTVYMVSFPPNISLTGPQGTGRSCVQFCGYHNTGTYGAAGTPLIYAALMDTFTGGCSAGCGGNATPLENATSLASHELAESTTDPDVGLDTQAVYAAPAAWADNNNGCGEIGDICDDGSAGATITVSGRSWVVQPLWSNAQNKCVASGTVQPICSGTTVTGCRKCSCGDDGNACGGSTSVCETSKTNVLFGGCEQCTSADNTCGGGTCQQSSTPSQDDICTNCTPLTSCPAGDNCGTVSDGCGGTLSCGTCAAPQTCGGGAPGIPNVCGCTPKSTCAAGDCGNVPDGCGGTLSCGGCTPPQTCGGGPSGNPNQCGCTPITTCPSGFQCGGVPDGCGGILSCGGCMAPQTCGGGGAANQCGCTPLLACPSGANCGTFPDGCGGLLTCGGSCAAPQTCGGGGAPNQCGCTPLKACPTGFVCGVIGDGCGGTMSCGSCGAGQSCVANQCVGPDGGVMVDSGTVDTGSSADSGTIADSGSSFDSGTFLDSGSSFDSGSSLDSGAHGDSGALADASSRDGASEDGGGDASGDGGGGPETLVGGCACNAVGAQTTGGSSAPLALGILGLLAGARLRRRAR
jgi:hypothetical protein